MQKQFGFTIVNSKLLIKLDRPKSVKIDPKKYYVMTKPYSSETQLYSEYKTCFLDPATKSDFQYTKSNSNNTTVTFNNETYACPASLDYMLHLIKQRKSLKKAGTFAISSTMIDNHNLEYLKQFSVWKKKPRLSLVADLRDSQNHIGDITLYPTMPNYEEGLKTAERIFKKCKAMGIETVLIFKPRNTKGNKPDSKTEAEMLKKGFSAIKSLAQTYNLKLLVTNQK